MRVRTTQMAQRADQGVHQSCRPAGLCAEYYRQVMPVLRVVGKAALAGVAVAALAFAAYVAYVAALWKQARNPPSPS